MKKKKRQAPIGFKVSPGPRTREGKGETTTRRMSNYIGMEKGEKGPGETQLETESRNSSANGSRGEKKATPSSLYANWRGGKTVHGRYTNAGKSKGGHLCGPTAGKEEEGEGRVNLDGGERWKKENYGGIRSRLRKERGAAFRSKRERGLCFTWVKSGEEKRKIEQVALCVTSLGSPLISGVHQYRKEAKGKGKKGLPLIPCSPQEGGEGGKGCSEGRMAVPFVPNQIWQCRRLRQIRGGKKKESELPIC